MKTKLFFIFLTLFLASTLYLPNTFAQDYTTWNLPEGAKARLGKGTIEDIQFSPDNKLLAVAGSIGVWIYDVDTGEKTGIPFEEIGIAFAGHTFKGLHTFEELALLTEHTGIVTSVAFSPDGSLLASGSMDNTIRLWNVFNFTLNQTITGHTREVNDVAFSPDGLALASASADKTVGIWSPFSGEEKMRFMDHTDAVTSVAFSPDGKTLASASADTTIRLWDTRTGEHQQTLTGHTDRVTSVAFKPDVPIDSDGKTLASGSWDNTVRLWDISTGDLKHTLTDSGTPTDIGIVLPMREVNSVSFRPDGYVLASGSRDGRIRLWATLTGELKQRVDKDQMSFGIPNSVLCFSPDGFALASGYRDGTLISLQVLPTLKHRTAGHPLSNNIVSFSPDGSMYASSNKTIHLWDIATGTLKQTFMTEDSGKIWDISFLPDGKTLTSIGREQVFDQDGEFAHFTAPTLRLWDISTGRLKRQVRLANQVSVPGNKTNLRSGAFSPDGLTLAVTDDDSGRFPVDSNSRQARIYLFDVFTSGLKQTFIEDMGDDYYSTIVFSPDSKTVVGGLWTGTIRLWSVETGELKQVIHSGIHPRSLAFSPDGRILVSLNVPLSGGEGAMRLWNTDTGKHLDTITSTSLYNSLLSGVFTPDGKMLSYLDSRSTTGSGRSRLIPFRGLNYTSSSPTFPPPVTNSSLWQLSDGKLEKSGTHVFMLAGNLSPDGVTLVTRTYSEDHYLIDVSTVSPDQGKQTISGYTGGVSNLSFSPEGSVLAISTFWIGDIHLWDVETITLKDTLESANSASVSFTPDGETFASGSWNAVKLWNVSAGEQQRTLTGHTGSVRSVAFGPNGFTLASGGDDKTVRLWNMETDTPQHTLTGHTDSVLTLAVNPHFTGDVFLASGSADKTVRFWESNPTRGEPLRTLTGHTDAVLSVAYNPNLHSVSAHPDLVDAVLNPHNVSLDPDLKKEYLTGRGGLIAVHGTGFQVMLASGSADKTIRLWDGVGGAYMGTLTGHSRGVSSLAFSPDGKTLMSGSYDTTIRWWELGKVVSEPSLKDPNQTVIWENPFIATHKHTFTGHTGGVTSLAFSPVHGWTLASGSYDGTVLLWDLFAFTPPSKRELAQDINDDGIVNIQDLVLVSANLGETGENPADVNGDGVVNIQDLVQVAAELGNAAAAPSIRQDDLASVFTKTEVEQWLAEALQLNLTDATSQRGIRFLESLLVMLTPQETALLANYPNPFNPETWIPYQLAEPADITLRIHAIDGSLVRTLSLGHKTVGIYQSRSRAAYWDGKNEVGEPVASGVYFYTLTAGDFNATRKMLIRK